MINRFYIKNMVCPRCIDTVGSVFDEIKIKTLSIGLGEVQTSMEMTQIQKKQLENMLLDKGFELLQDNNSRLISQIKAVIISQIHHDSELPKSNFSTLISEELNHEYTSLSKLFSSVEGITIERFIVKQKIEKVKEHLFYDEQTLAQIAFQLGYSSVAYLSAQFKKETGMTPTEFKKMKTPGHQSLDSI